MDIWGEGTWDINQQADVHEAKLLSLDISKAKHQLNWSPKWSINETVEKTVQWYKTYKNCDIYNLCTNQIAEYCRE